MADKVALVTGSSGGLGRAIVGRFSSCGWKVAGLDLHPPESGTRPDLFLGVDLEREGEIEEAVTELREEVGRLDSLVNNAALQICLRLTELTVEDWDRVMAVNLRAPFLCLREAVPLLSESGGSVVNVSSVHASSTSPEMSAYASSKGGLEAFTRAAALELADRGIRVNAVRPGAIDTQMLREGLERDHMREPGEAPLKSFEARQLLGRIASPEEIAEVVHFLADGERSSYLTGTSVVADGGATVRLSTE